MAKPNVNVNFRDNFVIAELNIAFEIIFFVQNKFDIFVEFYQ